MTGYGYYSSALTSITQSVLEPLSALGQRHSKGLLVHPAKDGKLGLHCCDHMQ